MSCALAKVVTVDLTFDCFLVTVTNCPYNDFMLETDAAVEDDSVTFAAVEEQHGIDLPSEEVVVWQV